MHFFYFLFFVYLSMVVNPKQPNANIPTVCTNMSDGFTSPCENELANNVTFKKITHSKPAIRFDDALPDSSFNRLFILPFKINMGQNQITGIIISLQIMRTKFSVYIQLIQILGQLN